MEATKTNWNRALTALILTGLFAASGPPHAACACAAEVGARAGAERLDKLIAKLGGRGTEAMMAAVTLGKIGDARAVAPLLSMAKAKGYSLRLAAVTALGLLGDRRATDAVMGVLDEADSQMRAAGAEALGLLGDRKATEVVARLLGDESPRVRLAAAEALGALRDPLAIRALVGVLDDEAASLRIASARALGAIGRRWAEGALARLLRDEDPAVRRAGLGAIRLLGPHRPAKRPGPIDKWVVLLRHRYSEQRAYAVRKLGQGGNPRAVGPLIAALGDRQVDVFLAASLWLGRLGGAEAVGALIETIETTRSPQRWTAAAAALAERKEQAAVGALLKHMVSRRFDVDVAAAGVAALGSIGEKSALAPLRKLRKTSAKLRLCSETLTGVMARLGDAESWAVVLDGARAASPAARHQAAVWLGYTQSARAVAPLAKLLSDIRPAVRAMAATALGNIGRQGQSAAASALAKALRDNDRAVRRAAAKALERLPLRAPSVSPARTRPGARGGPAGGGATRSE